MFVLIVGCGRVGSSVARSMLREGHEVSCLDEDPESHARLEVGLEKSWEDLGGQFTVGAGLESEALVAAGIERADAEWYQRQGLNTVCPTSVAIDMLETAVRKGAEGGSPDDSAAAA